MRNITMDGGKNRSAGCREQKSSFNQQQRQHEQLYLRENYCGPIRRQLHRRISSVAVQQRDTVSLSLSLSLRARMFPPLMLVLFMWPQTDTRISAETSIFIELMSCSDRRIYLRKNVSKKYIGLISCKIYRAHLVQFHQDRAH